MATTGLSYSELSEDAKEVALNSFINFYVDQYRRGSLEILSSQVSNELMATINQILRDNDFMGHQELVNVSTRLSKPAYQKILMELNYLDLTILIKKSGKNRSGKNTIYPTTRLF